jgi:hypothetical protein
MNLEEEIAEKLGKEIANEIDNEIMWGLRVVICKEQGWHLVNIDRFVDNEHAIDITHWIADNVKGQYHRNGRHFIFESGKDATMFLLRWA